MPILLAFLLALIPLVATGQSCGCEVSDRYEHAYDVLLGLSPAEQAEAERLHLPFGVPAAVTARERLLHQDEYVINYDEDLRVPLWVAYRLDERHLRDRRERTECFRRDVRLVQDEAAAFCSDYVEPVFDRGHMVPNADMTRSEAAMVNTYMFSNMVPQHDRFNRGIWSRLERYVRDWANLQGSIYVVTGAVFDRDDDGRRDEDADAERMTANDGSQRVAVPTHFYKIVLHERESTFVENLTLLLPHEDDSPPGDESEAYFNAHITTIDVIEQLTGIDFFQELRDDREFAIERNREDRIWPR